ncbi:unnamed protein product [Closterium sp. NIES-65]|nr:unnamed protein product [Closterium sp. NIES-65]
MGARAMQGRRRERGDGTKGDKEEAKIHLSILLSKRRRVAVEDRIRKESPLLRLLQQHNRDTADWLQDLDRRLERDAAHLNTVLDRAIQQLSEERDKADSQATVVDQATADAILRAPSVETASAVLRDMQATTVDLRKLAEKEGRERDKGRVGANGEGKEGMEGERRGEAGRRGEGERREEEKGPLVECLELYTRAQGLEKRFHGDLPAMGQGGGSETVRARATQGIGPVPAAAEGLCWEDTCCSCWFSAAQATGCFPPRPSPPPALQIYQQWDREVAVRQFMLGRLKELDGYRPLLKDLRISAAQANATAAAMDAKNQTTEEEQPRGSGAVHTGATEGAGGVVFENS